MPPVLSKLPVMMSDEDVIDKRYENGCIYMLRNKNDLENKNVYIGSTINFYNRYSDHKSSCNNENNVRYNKPKYQYIRENGGWDNWEMIKIEDYPCKNLKELMIREDEIMSKYENRINELRSLWTAERKKKGYDRYNYENREKRNHQEKERYKKNLEKIKARRQQRIICDNCGDEVSRNHIARHKKTKKCLEHNANIVLYSLL